MPSAINDLAFSQSMYDALLRVQEEMGGGASWSSSTPRTCSSWMTPRLPSVTMPSQGYDLVIAHGSQYGSSLQEIAPDFPETSFAWGTTVDTFGHAECLCL